MTMDAKLERALSRYRQVRDNLLNAEENSFTHHASEFVREVRRNALIKPILDGLPAFDVNAWLTPIAEAKKASFGPARLAFPDDDDEHLIILLDLLESMAAPPEARQLSVANFGQLLDIYKEDKATSQAIAIVVRPFCERLQERLHKALAIANPAVRELAGVPLNRIPAADETGIFLSHKTIDKPVVMPFHNVLVELGFSPWLDKDAMRAGDVVHRGISGGFDKACAVVFFITANFADERWLSMEIDEAIQRNIERGERFKILTLLFDGAQVPRALQRFRHITVGDPVEALRDLIRGLPVVLGPPRWRE
jgi:hypothetical protein